MLIALWFVVVVVVSFCTTWIGIQPHNPTWLKVLCLVLWIAAASSGVWLQSLGIIFV